MLLLVLTPARREAEKETTTHLHTWKYIHMCRCVGAGTDAGREAGRQAGRQAGTRCTHNDRKSMLAVLARHHPLYN